MPGADLEDELSAVAGSSIDAAATSRASEADVIEALKTVYDPEIPVNLYDLGLIYEIEIAADGNVFVQMTLTTPTCPVAGEMPQMVANAVAAIDGTGVVEVTLVWEPSWTSERMSETAKLALDID